MVRRQDFGVLLLYYLGYSRIRNLILRLRRKPVARFLVFHDVTPDASGRFEANLRFLKRRTNVVSIEDFFSGKLSPDRINVVITFDDGYKGWVSYVLPILKRLDLLATFFVCSGFVGLSQGDELAFMRTQLLIPDTGSATGCLKDEDVKTLARDGFTIGGHTRTHCNLGELRDPFRVTSEISEDKKTLETMTRGKIKFFAYPFGACQNEKIDLVQILKESGYLAAVTTVSGFNDVSTSPYSLHREITYASMPGAVFRARVYGNYDLISYLKRKFRKIIGGNDDVVNS